jgi:hypothetical protein
MVYLQTKFKLVEGEGLNQTRDELFSRGSNVYASDIMNDTGKLFQSPFWVAKIKEDPHWSHPAVSSWYRLVKNLEVKMKDMKDMLTWGPYLEFTCFMKWDPATKKSVPEKWVQLAYRDRGSETALHSAPEKYGDFIKNLKLPDRLQKIADEVGEYMELQ